MIAINVSDLTLRFGTTSVLEKVSFSLEENDKLGIIGANGSGKTSLFKLITGEYDAESGEVYISKGKTVGILSQYGAFDADESMGYEGNTPIEHMLAAFPALLAAEKRLEELELLLSDVNDPKHAAYTNEYTALHEKFIRDGGLEFRGRCRSILLKLGFDEDAIKKDVELLSGGQKTRLALAIQLCREPDILMLDEPTNHLDIETLGWLENYLIQYKKCVLVISHDRYFLDRVTNKTLAIEHHKAKLHAARVSCLHARSISLESLANVHGIAHPDRAAAFAREKLGRIVNLHILIDHLFHLLILPIIFKFQKMVKNKFLDYPF